jgi:hypothetical protein
VAAGGLADGTCGGLFGVDEVSSSAGYSGSDGASGTVTDLGCLFIGQAGQLGEHECFSSLTIDLTQEFRDMCWLGCAVTREQRALWAAFTSLLRKSC